MAVVDEIKGKLEEAHRRHRERLGKHAAFFKRFAITGNELTVVATGHNRKVPLLLVATASTPSSMEPRQAVVGVLRRLAANWCFMSWRSAQPKMHQLYRENMNHVNLYNKLRP
eukprot:4135860-Pleurochrysis_carterae.AAC.2